MSEYRRTLKGVKQNLEDIDKLEQKGLKSAVDRNKLRKEQLQFESRGLDIERKVDAIQDSILSKLAKQKGFELEIEGLKKLRTKGTKEEQKAAQDLLGTAEEYVNSQIDSVEFLSRMAQDYGRLNEQASIFGKLVADSAEDLEDSIKTSAKFKEGFDTLSEAVLGFNIKQTLSFAGLLALAGAFVLKIKEVRQELGTTVVQSTRLAGNMSLAAASATAFGGSAEQAQAAVTSLVDEFGSLDVVSARVSAQLGSITGQFGLSGDNAGKLLKQMQAINGASIETNLNLIGSVGELARAEGVAPAKVLNDIASDTESFALFARDGGRNIARAAIQAAKLGINMGKVASIAESLLDFETSIEKQMEASVLLGRQLNLDKARELALTGDLESLQRELVRQVGTQAEFQALNFIQRKALADAIGVSAAELGKLVAGGGGIAAGAPKAQTGGVVRQTGLAVIHRGETITGSQFGGRESNNLLKQLIEQNATLMGRLTNKVSDLGLNS